MTELSLGVIFRCTRCLHEDRSTNKLTVSTTNGLETTTHRCLKCGAWVGTGVQPIERSAE